ncbi:hypothetical protein ACJX0J_007081, partial [Zea mays]
QNIPIFYWGALVFTSIYIFVDIFYYSKFKMYNLGILFHKISFPLGTKGIPTSLNEISCFHQSKLSNYVALHMILLNNF